MKTTEGVLESVKKKIIEFLLRNVSKEELYLILRENLLLRKIDFLRIDIWKEFLRRHPTDCDLCWVAVEIPSLRRNALRILSQKPDKKNSGDWILFHVPRGDESFKEIVKEYLLN